MTAADALAEPVAPVPVPEPPSRQLTPAQWLRANLFSTPLNAVLTVVSGTLLAYALFRLARWAFVTSDWEIVRANLRLFMIGRYPSDQLWRPWASGYVVAATIGLAGGALASVHPAPGRRRGRRRRARRPGPLGARATGCGRWPRLAVVTLSMTRTVLPTVLTVGLVATFVVPGWSVPGYRACAASPGRWRCWASWSAPGC